ncbi:hypothetical protein Back11_12010 [Paenibacillus baekrokdamisoli]|uniref:Uncharacterized protein n=1 Tax=Paenibacillus baekrokdamisoli TaxID=1712516 RepID=A0A3G9ING6_9BACL|nr:hypothetical protein [Paenibacillus baekrokdamisoli]MBB3070506.1 hypothetical protein [Paenibacillus baekrokdamisoli]BBH19856.1 hypothetical protein Back11_12010 [Paenibacillus baekrokdamisoli]
MEEIRSAIVNKLSLSFPDYPVFDEQVTEGSQVPYFMVVETSNGQKKAGNRRVIRSSTFNVHFFPGLLNPRSECRIMNEWCYEHLSNISFEGNTYQGRDLHAEIVDKVLHFFINFDVHLLLPREPVVIMENIVQEEHIK